MISPFGGASNRCASSRAAPRTTSSNRFVSSRQTATSRSGSAPASERSVAGSKPLLPAREKAEKAVLLGHEPRRDECRLDGGRPRQHRHVHPRVDGGAHKPGTWIGHAGKSGVGDERDSLACLEPRQKLGSSLRLVVLVVREQADGDAVPFEQDASMASVLTEHDLCCGKLGEHA